MATYVIEESGRVVTEELAKIEENQDELQLFAIVDKVDSSKDSGKEQGV
jgi:hypothetical protein